MSGPDGPSSDALRGSVAESFNIYQATVAMCSIFMGFVFAALLQLLVGEATLNGNRVTAIGVLVGALMFLVSGLIGFHITAHQVVRYWGIFFPASRAQRFASRFFQAGVLLMLFAVVVLLFGRGLRLFAGLLGGFTAVLVPFVLGVGGLHADASYVRDVEARVSTPRSVEGREV